MNSAESLDKHAKPRSLKEGKYAHWGGRSQRDRGAGNLLRSWRARRGKSQLDISLLAEISQRHLSFIESGRSAPSRQKLLDIAEALDIPLRERNALLLAAGFAPVYPENAWNDPQMKSITAAVERMLKQQEPYPAVLMDRYWNVSASSHAKCWASLE